MALLPFDTPSRWTLEAIRRADERAQDRGLFAYVASRAALGALGDGEFYRDQLRTMLVEAIYDFAFSARRAIECVDTVEPGLIDAIRGLNLKRAGWVFRSYSPNRPEFARMPGRSLELTIGRYINYRLRTWPHSMERASEEGEYVARGIEMDPAHDWMIKIDHDDLEWKVRFVFHKGKLACDLETPGSACPPQ
jgi:hypothetical protein